MPKGEVEAGTILAECLAGVHVIWGNRALRVLIGLLTAQTFVAGLVMVYMVVIAIETLDLGDSGVGYLNAAFGVGALIGALGALGLTGAKRLSPGFLFGLCLWGAPLIVLAFWQSTLAAVILFGIVGVGNSFVDVAGFTLVQRAVPDEVLARVFGVIQFTWLSSVGIGGVLAPVLLDALGTDTALDRDGRLPARARRAPGRARREDRRRRPQHPRRRSSGCCRPCRSSRRCPARRSSTSPAGSCRSASTQAR